MSKTWGQVGREAAKELQGMTDEKAIAQLGQDLVAQIREREAEDKRGNAHSMVSREIRKVFPNQSDEQPLYWHDPRGKGDRPKWRHLIFKSFTLSSEEWGTAGYKAAQSPENKSIQSQPTTGIMTQLQLDPETQQTLDAALAATGMEPMELIGKAIASYAKSIVNKRSVDLETLSTEKLLHDSSYSTLPGRAEELTKRAIRAIMHHNSEMATENGQRWAITQSIIATLTGARPASVGKAMKPYRGMVEEHNGKYGLNGYTNRSQEKPIHEVIDLATLVPDGLD